ncbi:asparagine synthase (glutamine-hydrolyzing) [uncultured Helicobacter sp.]|uniref:asparagine synthase (glutamine-hydrolyzing) n=1 Tax=uncultured Helicobacter sp. TaxID=175537 RepID=UPI00374E91C4
MELREELKLKGYSFCTHSDTEVVLASYDCWGEQCLNRFNGMWALAIWDHTKKRLFLSRDRFGKKPLFYAFVKDKQGRDMFVFASEMKAIYPYLREIKPSAYFNTMSDVKHIFSYEQRKDHTLVEGIYRFPYSCYAYYDPKQPQSLKYQRYYCILDHLIAPPNHYGEAVERFRELFLDSVSLRMHSDVSIGTALSGGVDSSSTICAMAYLAKQGLKAESKDWQHAFVACFKDTPQEESHYAREVVNHISIKAKFLEINPLENWDRLEYYFYLLEDLYGRIPLAQISTYQAIKENGVSVTLDGHGADELLCGYGHLIYALWDCRYNPSKIYDILNTSNQTLAHPLPMPRVVKNGISFLAKSFIKKMIGRKFGLDSQDASHPNFHTMDFFTQQLYVIFYETLLPVILRDYDRYSMMNSLEIRMPFMDHRLVEFLFSLPFDYKNGYGYTKRIVRDSMSEIVPKSVIWRKHKIGFNAPMIQWIQRDRAHNGLREYFLDLAHSQDFLQCPFVKNPQYIQEAIVRICSMEASSPHLAEEIWCALNPYIWSKSLKYAVRF